MNEKIKVQEAEYFLSKMSEVINERQFINFNLSAFLSAARSVLQYTLKEASTKPNGQLWYDSAVKNRPVVRFFKDKRDVNIHRKPVKPSAEIHVAIAETISLSDSVSITVTDKNENILEQKIIPPSEPTRRIQPDDTTVNYRYFFRDWSGTEDIFKLSLQYIKELKEIVNDGVTIGFITD